MINLNCEKNGKLSEYILKNVKGISFSALNKLFRKKDIKVNGKRVSKDQNVFISDKIEIYYEPKEICPADKVFVDKNVLIVDKKIGFTSEETFEYFCKEYKNLKFIHRLDRNTNGILIFALNEKAEKELLFGFKNRTFIKQYIAKVIGKMEKEEDLLTAYLVKDADKSLVKIFDKKVGGSTVIKTGYKVIDFDGKISTLKVDLYTGKTHQIRAHLSHIGHPVLGDGKYGDNKINKEYKCKTQQLTAKSLTLKFEKTSCLYYLNDKTFEVK